MPLTHFFRKSAGLGFDVLVLICYDTRDKPPPHHHHQFSEQRLVKISLFSTKNCRKILQGSETKKSFSPLFTYLAFPILISCKIPEWHSGSTEAEAIFFISPSSQFELFFVSKIFESKATHDSNITEHWVSITFATLQAIRMPTTYKCPDRIYWSGQIFVIQLCTV